MEKASKLITIKLNKKQATLLDLHTISKDTLEVIVLLSLLENVDDEIGEELRNIIRKNYPKKDLFRHSKKIKSYVHDNINRFSLEKIENGSIYLTIKVSRCIYKMFEMYKDKKTIKDIELILRTLKCLNDIGDLIDFVEYMYGEKIKKFFDDYEIDF